MRNLNRKAYVLAGARIPFAKSRTHYASVSRKELMAAALNALVGSARLEGRLLGDVALGAVMQSSSDFNMAREVVLSMKLDPSTPGYNVQRACGTGLETAWQIALKANSGAMKHGVAGGVDTNSDMPIEVSPALQRAAIDLNGAKTFGEKAKILARLAPRDLIPKTPTIDEPRTGLSMGGHTELMAKEWNVTRAEQDEFALASHRNAAKAYEVGFYEGLVFPFGDLKRDATVRADTSLEKLEKLKPAFGGSLTAGNSSPLTDGAAAVLIANEDGARELGLDPLAEIVDVESAAVDFVAGAGLLMAPAIAVSRLLERNGLGFEDFDYFEIHEAFAGQVLCTLKAWESPQYARDVLKRAAPLGPLDRAKLNVVGSSLALGHPFAATGARIVGTLAKLLAGGDGRKRRGLISICTAGGMGIAAIMESAS